MLSSNRLKELLKLSAGAMLGLSDGAAVGEPAAAAGSAAPLAIASAAGAGGGAGGEGEPPAVELSSQQVVIDCYKGNPAMVQWVTGEWGWWVKCHSGCALMVASL